MSSTLEKFDLISEESIAECNSEGLLYRHKATGCEVFHIKNSDVENLFSFIFMTPPEDDCGTAHIMEHSVLAGSRHFPVKDPFLQLMKGSVNTFLNAMTYPDRTAFPASSTVEKDYFNLMKVYGDAVFFPLLREETFWQEGIRWENGWQGIVYNEMQGAYSEQAGVLEEYSRRALFPDVAYKYDSGGVPDAITELTYGKFLDFHKKHYTPSNCKIFLYGNIDTEKQLEFIESEFLCKFSKNTGAVPCVALQKKYSKPIECIAFCPPSEGDSSGSASVNWLCGPAADTDYKARMRVLSYILLSTPSSLLYRRIVESDIAEDVASVTGFSGGLRQCTCSVGVRGIEKSRVDEFRNFVFKELEEIASKPIDSTLIEAAISKSEFYQKAIKERNGLRLMDRVMEGWLYTGRPSACLCMNAALERLKAEYKDDPLLFNRLIKSELLDNTHYSLVSVFPGTSESSAKKSGSTDIAKFDAYKNSADSPEDLAKIPVLHKGDIPRELKKPSFVKWNAGDDIGCQSKLFTGGIVYTNILFDLSHLSDEHLRYIPMLAAVLEETGIPGMPYYDVASRMDLLAGSWFMTTYHSTAEDAKTGKYFMASFASLADKAHSAAEFLSKILNTAVLDDLSRLKAIITTLRNDFKESVLDYGNRLARISASAGFSEAGSLDALWNGLPQLAFLQSIDVNDKDRLNCIAAELAYLRHYIFGQKKIIDVVSDADWDAKVYVDYIRTLFPADAAELSGGREPFVEFRSAECYPTAAAVNYDALVLKVKETRTDMISESALANILSAGYLWEKIRMEGGAYGAGASCSMSEKLFAFTSYRDPAVGRTYDAYKSALEEIARNGVSDDVLEKTVITMAGEALRPLSPENQGFLDCRRDMDGITYELRKKRREILLSLSASDIVDAARSLLKEMENSSMAVIAGKDAMKRERKFFDEHRFKMTKIRGI